jgi:TnpA family transposase
MPVRLSLQVERRMKSGRLLFQHAIHRRLVGSETNEGADRALLLTVILADAINLGLNKMAEACPGTSVARLSWYRLGTFATRPTAGPWLRSLTISIGKPFASHWGEGTTSSSDGQRFQPGGRGEEAGKVNLRYGTEASVLFYTHLSDHYAPFHTKVLNATVRDATHVLDGLLYHESDLRIEEHYTDTAGFTDHVFALCHLLRSQACFLAIG